MQREDNEPTYIDGVLVEKIPTMGEAESIKTIKQGRNKSLKTIATNITYADLARKEGTNILGRKAYKGNTISMTRVLCNRILKFDKSSAGQKKLCYAWLNRIDREEKNFYSDSISLARKIQNINRSLFRKFKEYREI